MTSPTGIGRKKTATLLLSCPDQKGLVATISQFLYKNGANIVHADQHQDTETGLFLMRVEWDLDSFILDRNTFQNQFTSLANTYAMNWKLAFSEEKTKVAIFVSKYDHCLVDLLYRHQIGELTCVISFVASNHKDAKELTEFYNLPFFEISTQTGKKEEFELKQNQLLDEHQVDLVILARYMQILSPSFVKAFHNRIINIHHSFLPAFIGAKPYHQAFARGVKLIGATSHFVTEELDDGPIIHQDVVRISHRDQVEDLVQKGRDLEKIVLSRSVKLHLENKVIVYGNKTVVFD